MKSQANILCVVVEPDKLAEIRSIDYSYEYGQINGDRISDVDAKDLAQFEALKAIIKSDMLQLLSYPSPLWSPKSIDPHLFAFGDEEGRINSKPNRNGYWGTIVVCARGKRFGEMISMTKFQAQRVLREMNIGMP